MSLRTDQVGSVLHRVIQELLSRGLNDPRVRGLVSVTSVSVSDDLAHATVHVSVLPATHAELALHGLNHAARHIRSRLGDAVTLRRVPALVFKLDDSLKKEATVIAAINEARRADEERAASRPEGEEAQS